MLTYTQQGAVAVLDLDDGKANAIGHAFAEAVHEGLDRAEREARAVAIIGRPGRFCAGFDLNEFKKGPAETQALLQTGAKLYLRLLRHPQPVVAGCTGHAIAGGALLLLTADTRVAARGEFKIGLNESLIGMVLPPFGLILSELRLSRRHLQTAVIQGRLFDPGRAQDAGFVDEVVDPDAVRIDAIAAAAALSEIPNEAYVGNKLNLRKDAIDRLEASIPALRGA